MLIELRETTNTPETVKTRGQLLPLCLKRKTEKIMLFILIKAGVRKWKWSRSVHSLPGFSVHGIFQARVPEWVAISFSRGSSQPMDRTQVSHTAGRRFTLWAPREAHGVRKGPPNRSYSQWKDTDSYWKSHPEQGESWKEIFYPLSSMFLWTNDVRLKSPCISVSMGQLTRTQRKTEQ